MSEPRLPPSPEHRDLRQWAMEMHEYLQQSSPISRRQDPRPILLAHQVAGVMARASTDGIVMYDPDLGNIVYSKAGLWVPLKDGP